MSLPNKSLKILQDLFSKDIHSLTSIEVDVAKKHLLELYECLMLVDLNVQEGESFSSKKNKSSTKIKQEGQSLFDVLYPLDEEQEGVDRKEEATEKSFTEADLVIEEKSEIKKNDFPSFDDMDDESNLTPIQVNISKEDPKVFDVSLEDTREKEVEENKRKEQGRSELRDQIQVAFEPPLSQDDFLDMWTPSDPEIILQEPTKSGFSDVKEDLNLEKKAFSRGNIRALIGINDRYLFSNELFDNKEEYEKALDHLNELPNISEAKAYLDQFFSFQDLDLDQQVVKDEVKDSFIKMLESYYRY